MIYCILNYVRGKLICPWNTVIYLWWNSSLPNEQAETERIEEYERQNVGIICYLKSIKNKIFVRSIYKARLNSLEMERKRLHIWVQIAVSQIKGKLFFNKAYSVVRASFPFSL